jgi:FkbM family methyltransferase
MIRDREFFSPWGPVTMATRPGTTDELICRDVIENDAYRLNAIHCASPLIFDVGANIGAFSALALQRWPDAEVIAFEPHPLNYGLLRHNVRGFNATAYLAAVFGWSLPQSVIVERPHDEATEFGGWGLAQVPHHYEPDFVNEVGIHCDLIDPETAFARARSTTRPVILKMDCEGAEFSIIDGLSTESLRSIDYIVGEIHQNAFDLDYFQGSWFGFRGKLLESFYCAELENRPTLTGELFTAIGFQKCKKQRQ